MDRVSSQEEHVPSTYNVGAKFVASRFSMEKRRIAASNMGHPYCLKRDDVALPRIYLTLKQQEKLFNSSSDVVFN